MMRQRRFISPALTLVALLFLGGGGSKVQGGWLQRASGAPVAPALSNGTLTAPGPISLLRSVQLTSPATAFIFTPDSRNIAFVSNGGVVRLWNVETGELKLVRSGDKPKQKGKSSVTASSPPGNSTIAFSPDGKKLAVAGLDDVIHLCDLQTGQEKLLKGDLFRLESGAKIVTTLGFSNDGQTLIAAGEVMKLWDLRAGRSRLLREVELGHTRVKFSPDRTSLAVTEIVYSLTGPDRSSSVELRDSHTGTVRWKHSAPELEGGAAEIAFSADGKTLATMGDTTRLWDTHTGTVKGEVPVAVNPDQFYNAGALTPDGKTLAVSLVQTPTAQGKALTGQVALYDTVTRKPLWKTAKLDGQPQVLGFSADGTLLVDSDFDIVSDAGNGAPHRLFGGNAVVRFWDAKSGKFLKALTKQTGLALSPDGKLLLAGDWDTDSYKVWRLGAPSTDHKTKAGVS